MTRPRLLLFGIVWLGLVAFAGYEHHYAAQLRASHIAAAAELLRLRSKAESLRREQAATAAELAQTEQQLAAAAPARTEGPAADYAPEIARWLERVKHLRRLFDEKPEQRIPEMNLLTDDDWLRVGQAAKFDTEDDTRRALAAVRTAAIQHFARQLSPVLRAYAKAFPDERPASLQALTPFFKQPPDPAILARYEFQEPSGPAGFGPSTWFVQNKTPVDLIHDSRFRVSASSSFQNDGAHAWIPDYFARYEDAARAYATANAGRSPERTTDALPFFNPPLAPDVAAALIRSESGR